MKERSRCASNSSTPECTPPAEAPHPRTASSPRRASSPSPPQPPPQHDVRICDENLAPLDVLDRPDLVGITVYVASARRAYEIAAHYRRRRVPVVLGGLHVSACPDEALRHADSIVVGEADRVWPQLLADAGRGRLRPRYDPPPPELDRLPALPRQLVPPRAYLTRNSILATRGCNRRCAFCYKTSLSRSPLRKRPVREVLDEIRCMEGDAVVFLDDNLAADPAYARSLFTALRDVNKVWMGAASIDLAADESLLDTFADSGCCSLFVGIESIRQCNLDRMRKGWSKVVRREDYVRRIRDRGIMVNGSFVFGFDGDDPRSFDETVDWAIRCNLDTATFHILTPYPGTPLWNRLQRQRRITDLDWSHYDTSHVVFRPKRMTPDELLAGYVRAYDRFYAWPAVFARALADPWGGLPRLLLNVGYKRMNPLWPVLGRSGLAAATFSLFVKALRLHRRRWAWDRADFVRILHAHHLIERALP